MWGYGAGFTVRFRVGVMGLALGGYGAGVRGRYWIGDMGFMELRGWSYGIEVRVEIMRSGLVKVKFRVRVGAKLTGLELRGYGDEVMGSLAPTSSPIAAATLHTAAPFPHRAPLHCTQNRGRSAEMGRAVL